MHQCICGGCCCINFHDGCSLVMVAVFSLSAVMDISFDDIVDQLTAFFTIATMGFTYSIANGICAASSSSPGCAP